jgi:hypothetical protein
MTSIRIAIATALAAAAVFAGGTAHAQHSEAAASKHNVALAAAPSRKSPPLCCWG